MATTNKQKNPFQVVIDEVDDEMGDKESTQPVKDTRSKGVQDASAEMLRLERAQRKLVKEYSEQEKISVRIPPSYRKYFGNIMRVVINGIAVSIPCDGSVFAVPEEFAIECERRMREMDDYELKSKKLADVTCNSEKNIGQLSFF